jgi:hypothetical protein
VHQLAIEANTLDVKIGTAFDDENFVVRHGTEPILLIAEAAGLEAFIPTAMQLPYRSSKSQKWVAVPERHRKPCSVKVLFRKCWEWIISLSRNPGLGQMILPWQGLFSP